MAEAAEKARRHEEAVKRGRKGGRTNRGKRKAPTLLSAMRWVAKKENKAAEPPSELHAKLREMFDHDFPKFSADWRAAEREYRAAFTKETPPAPEGEQKDEGGERCLELIEQLLADAQKEAQ